MIQNNELLYWHNLSQGLWFFDCRTSCCCTTYVQVLSNPKYLKYFLQYNGLHSYCTVEMDQGDSDDKGVITSFQECRTAPFVHQRRQALKEYKAWNSIGTKRQCLLCGSGQLSPSTCFPPTKEGNATSVNADNKEIGLSSFSAFRK